jgi:hypothetical protein
MLIFKLQLHNNYRAESTPNVLGASNIDLAPSRKTSLVIQAATSLRFGSMVGPFFFTPKWTSTLPDLRSLTAVGRTHKGTIHEIRKRLSPARFILREHDEGGT